MLTTEQRKSWGEKIIKVAAEICSEMNRGAPCCLNERATTCTHEFEMLPLGAAAIRALENEENNDK